MYRYLTVTTPATSYDLTTTAAVKTELGITDTSEDAKIAGWITDASKAAALICNRVFLQETVKETIRDNNANVFGPRHESIVLTRNPVSSIASVTLNGETLVEGTDFECDYTTGILYRLDGTVPVDWRFRYMVIQYTAGYASNAIPPDLARGIIGLVKLFRATATRDPSLRSENILSGLYSYTLFGPNDSPTGIPADVEALFGPYRNIGI